MNLLFTKIQNLLVLYVFSVSYYFKYKVYTVTMYIYLSSISFSYVSKNEGNQS